MSFHLYKIRKFLSASLSLRKLLLTSVYLQLQHKRNENWGQLFLTPLQRLGTLKFFFLFQKIYLKHRTVSTVWSKNLTLLTSNTVTTPAFSRRQLGSAEINVYQLSLAIKIIYEFAKCLITFNFMKNHHFLAVLKIVSD